MADYILNPPKQYTITLAAGELNRFAYEFDYIRFLSIDKPENLKMIFGDTGAETDILGAGLGFKLPYVIRNAGFRNTSLTKTLTITFAVAIGQIFDDRVILSASSALSVDVTSSITLPVSEVIPTVLDSAPDVAIAAASATLVKAANTSRREIILCNPPTNVSTFRIGDSGVTSGHGIILPVGSSCVLTTTAAVYAYSTTAQNISATEINA